MSNICAVVRHSLGSSAISLSWRRNALVSFSRTFADSKEKKRGKTPLGKLDQTQAEETADKEKPDPYAPFPDNRNPITGEVGGPRGPEPTRYGDWERKGRVSDF
ncbi:hypothetical protein X975_14777, partial [Stegodyphus mimosarum]